MKIGIFTDSHYSSKKCTCGQIDSLQKIKQAYTVFKSENCELVICLGDLIDEDISRQKEIENLTAIANVIADSKIKTICVMGNHDAFTFTEAEFYEILGDCKPAPLSIDGKNLLFADACYFKNGRHYLPGDSDWTDTFYPHTQELKQQIAEAAGDVYLFMHQNIDPNMPEDYMLYNLEEINRILQDSGKVKAVYQGHYHLGMESRHGSIDYCTFPAMFENESAHFILTL